MSTTSSHTGTHRLLDALRPLVRFPLRGLKEERVFAWSTRRGPLRTIHFQTPDGTVLVQLFAAMSEGRFSGVIQAVPRTSEGLESQSQAARLAEYFINAGDAVVAVGAGALEAKFVSGDQLLTLTNDWGRELARTSISVEPSPAGRVSPVLVVPLRCQSGEPLAIEAALFDGRLPSSSISLGGRSSQVVAVNQRAAITVVDEGLTGCVPLTVSGARGRMTASIQVVRATLDCVRTELACGESTWIEVAAEGSNIEETVVLCNHAPGVVALPQGELMRVIVPAGQVKRLRLTGIRSGSFAVTAQLDGARSSSSSSVQTMRAAAIAGRVKADGD